MSVKLHDSELKIMNVLWKDGDLTAKQISIILGEQIGWNQNTTYTVIKKCIAKGAIERREPNFVCHALIGKDKAQSFEIKELVDKLFDGSADMLFASLLDNKDISGNMIEKLKALVGELGGEPQ